MDHILKALDETLAIKDFQIRQLEEKNRELMVKVTKLEKQTEELTAEANKNF